MCSVSSTALSKTSSLSWGLNAMTGPRLVSASPSASPTLTSAAEGWGSRSRNGTPLATIRRSSREWPTRALATARATTHARMIGARTSRLAVASMMITTTAAVMRVNPLSIAAEPIKAYVPLFAPGLTRSARNPNRRPSVAPMSMFGMNTPAGNAPPKVTDAMTKKYAKNAATTGAVNSGSEYSSSRANRCFTTPSSFWSIRVAISLNSPSAHVY